MIGKLYLIHLIFGYPELYFHRKLISGWWHTYPSEKYDFVSWDDFSEYMKNKKSNQQSDLLAKLKDSRDQLDLDLPSLTLTVRRFDQRLLPLVSLVDPSKVTETKPTLRFLSSAKQTSWLEARGQ